MLLLWRSNVENFNFLRYCRTANDEVADRDTFFIFFQTIHTYEACALWELPKHLQWYRASWRGQRGDFLTAINSSAYKGTRATYPSQYLNSEIEPEADEDPEVNLPPLSFKVEDQKI